MDPVSLAFGIAGLVPLIAKAIKCATEYRSAVHTARETITALILELEALQFSAGNLQKFLECDNLAGDNLRFQQTSVLLSCSTACGAKLKALCQKLGQEASGKRSRYLWPLSEKEHQKTLQELRNFTSWMHFALSIDGCRLLSRTSDDVLKVLGQQLEHFKTIQSLDETVALISSTVQEQKRGLEDSAEREARKQMLDWISTTKYYQKHHALRESRARNAGDWILQSPEYVRWRDGSDQTNTVLWCQGIQGSGKTNLVSIIIDNLLSPAQTPPQGVAYFYFDHQEQSAQLPATVFACILRQLLDRHTDIPKSVSRVYDDAGSKGVLPQDECGTLLAELIKELGCVYLVLDALDECASEHRVSFLQSLGQLSHVPGLRILITSRPHVHEIASTFTHRLDLKIAARGEDIKLYLRQELTKHDIYEMADEEFANELIRRLTQGADGMFLLPVLQLRTILNEPTVGEMEDSLDNLSHNLTGAFEETIRRIQSMPPSRSRMGMEILMYLTHSARTIAVHELRDLLSARLGATRLNVKYRPTERMILECCQGLITVDIETGDVRPCHYSVKEYLLRNDHRLFPRAEAIFATKCLHYMMMDNFSTGPWAEERAILSYTRDHAFLSYAARFWGSHAKLSEDDDQVQTALGAFFASTRAMATANQVRQHSVGYRDEYWAPEECLGVTALHHACRQGLTLTVGRLLSTGRFDVNVTTREGSTPIIHAASNGHVDIVRLLLQSGADPYLRNWYGNALHCAVEGGRVAVVRELVVGWGMDVRDADMSGREYLHHAMDHDSDQVFGVLVDLGVDIRTGTSRACAGPGHATDSAGFDIFLSACVRGCPKIVQLMVDRGWVSVNMRSAKGQTALHWTAYSRNRTMVERLIELGADVNAADDGGVSALDLIQPLYRSMGLEFVTSTGKQALGNDLSA